MGYDFIIIKKGIEYKCLVTLMHDINMAKSSAYLPVIFEPLRYKNPKPPSSPIPYLKSPIDGTVFYDTTGEFIILYNNLFTIPFYNEDKKTKYISNEFHRDGNPYYYSTNEKKIFKDISMIVSPLAFAGFDITIENDKFTITNNYPLPLLNSIRNLYFENQNLHIKMHITKERVLGIMHDINTIEKNSYPCKCSEITQNKNSKLYIISRYHDISTPCIGLEEFALTTPMKIIKSSSGKEDFYLKISYPIILPANINLIHNLIDGSKHEDEIKNTSMKILPEARGHINLSSELLNPFDIFFTDVKTQLPYNELNGKSLKILDYLSDISLDIQEEPDKLLKDCNFIGSHIVGGKQCTSRLHICSKHRMHWLEIIEDICPQI